MSGPRCHLCDDPAVAVFYFSRGCHCDPAEVQALCPHHAFKSGPARGGTMELIADLSIDGSFEDVYMSPPGCYATADRTDPPRMAPGAPRPCNHDRDRDRPQLVVELDRLNGLAEGAAGTCKLAHALRDRLAPVLRPLPMASPAGGNGTAKLVQGEVLVPPAADLREVGDRIEGHLCEANATLHWLIEALGI